MLSRVIEQFIKKSFESRLLIFWLCINFLLTVLRFILHRIGIDTGITRELLLFVISSIPIILFILKHKKVDFNRYKSFIVLIGLVLISIGLTTVLNSSVIPFLFRSGYGLDRVIRPDSALYAYLFFVIIKEPKILINDLKLFSYLEFIYLTVVELMPALIRGYWLSIGANGKLIKFSYNLTYGYSMVLPTIMFLYIAYKEKSKKNIILGMIGFYLIATQGNRGAIILIALFIILMGFSILLEKLNIKRLLKITVSICIILGMGYFSIRTIIPNLYEVQQIITYKIKENNDDNIIIKNYTDTALRNTKLIKSGNFIASNGRKTIWDMVIKGIKEGGILGHGFFGDRPYVIDYHYVAFSHNIILEMIISFGIIGMLIILGLIYQTVKILLFSNNKEWRELFIILFTCSSQLLISMSFWYIWQFWAMLAVMYNYNYYLSDKNKINQ